MATESAKAEACQAMEEGIRREKKEAITQGLGSLWICDSFFAQKELSVWAGGELYAVLAAYAEAIQEKVQKDSEQVIKELVEERYRQKKTQQEMADITGVSASNIARFERAGCTPTLIMLEKYANALGKHIEIRVCEDK